MSKSLTRLYEFRVGYRAYTQARKNVLDRLMRVLIFVQVYVSVVACYSAWHGAPELDTYTVASLALGALILAWMVHDVRKFSGQRKRAW